MGSILGGAGVMKLEAFDSAAGIVGRTARTCIRCGVGFAVPKPSQQGKYCSTTCQSLARRLPDAAPRNCLGCGCMFTPARKRANQEYCSRPCFLRTQRTPEHQKAAAKAAAAAREHIRGTGQKHPYVKEGGRHQHRMVAEEKIGRPLTPGEVVHHRDENGHNNAPSNLDVLPSQAEHARLHFTGTKQNAEHVAKRVAATASTKRLRSLGLIDYPAAGEARAGDRMFPGGRR